MTEARVPFRRAIPWTGTVLVISAAVSALPLRDALLLAGGLVAVLVGVLTPVSGLALLALGVPFGAELGLTLGGFRFGLAEAGLALAATAWFLSATARQELRLRGLGIWVPLGVIIAVAFLSAAQAESLHQSFKEAAKWLVLGATVTLAATLITNDRRLLLVLAALLLAGAAEALYGLDQASAGAGPLGYLLGGSALRAFGTFGQPNPFAAYLATVAVVAGGLFLAYGGRRPSLLLMAIAVVLLAGVAASLSRSAWVGLLAAASAVLAVHHRRGIAILLLLLGAGALTWALGGVGWLPPVVATRLETLTQSFSWFDPQSVPLTSANFAVVHRMAIWQAAWEMFQENPWLGVGPGNFDVAYPHYALPGWPQLPGHAHNFYLNLLAETGVLGLLSYLGLLAFLGGRAYRALNASRVFESPLRYGAALAGVGLIALLMAYQVFDNLYVHSMTAQAGLIFGLALAAAGPRDEHHQLRDASLRSSMTIRTRGGRST